MPEITSHQEHHQASIEVDRLRRRRVDITSELHAMDDRAGQRKLSAGEQTRWDNHTRAVKKIDDQLEELHTEMISFIERSVADGSMIVIPGVDTPSNSGGPVVSRVTDATRTAGLRAVAVDRVASDETRQAVTVAIERDESGNVAKWASAAASPDYLRAYVSLLVDPDRGHLSWSPAERQAYDTAQTVARAMSIGTPTSGGNLVPMSLDPTWILTGNGTTNPLREISRIVQTNGSTWKGVTTDGVTAEWKTEGAQASDGSPTDIGQPSIPVHLADVFVPFSFEVEQDTLNLAQELATAMAEAKAAHEATAFTVGSGSGQPKGIITAVAATPGSIVSPITPETFADGDIYKVASALPARHQANATWLTNPTLEYKIRQFAAGSGPSHAFWADLGAGTPPALLGKPYRTASDMDDTWDSAVTANNYLVLLGDFSRYVIADRVGVVTELVPHIPGTNGRPTGQRGLFMYWRTGADCVDPNAFRLLNLATTA